jgi:hypothetical protein
MPSDAPKLAGIALVLLAGIAAGVWGVVLLVLDRQEAVALTATACGLGLVAWVIFHPARARPPRQQP